ncbi:hypothetical protein [Mesorhizobium sp. LSHC414A00]|uniref:hypothetical protein n=1 Tax=Mesorhizobium sp. LSHC414A00 TaxID=1287287 RepID=UPI0003CE7BA2|nr:hypothetical protein [Mesorhizobium sp. LSHC414A00]ESX78466.1 hypothetical protein X757_08815 [Mesorhizobium sp. LSHC414A00]
MLDWIKRKYVELCERVEGSADRMETETAALEAARKEREAVDAAIAKAGKILDKS